MGHSVAARWMSHPHSDSSRGSRPWRQGRGGHRGHQHKSEHGDQSSNSKHHQGHEGSDHHNPHKQSHGRGRGGARGGHSHGKKSKAHDSTLQRCLFRQMHRNGPRALRILSYNILADALLYKHLYLYQNYHNAQLPVEKQPYFFQWKYRKELLLRQILGPRQTGYRIPNIFERLHYTNDQIIQPDLICLQEVDHFEELSKELKQEGYRGLFKKRTGERTDGCAVFYKQTTIHMEAHHYLEFNRSAPHCAPLLSSRTEELTPVLSKLYEQTPVRVQAEYDESKKEYRCFEKKLGASTPHEVLDRDNVAILALFRETGPSNKFFCVATTHLLYNPKRGDIKLLQADLLVHEIMAFLQVHDLLPHETPLIICGDFNSTPYSSVYDYMAKNSVSVHPGHPFWHYTLSGTCQDHAPAVRFLSSPSQLEEQLNQQEAAEAAANAQRSYFMCRTSPDDMETATFSHPLELTSAYCSNGKEPPCTTAHRKAHETVDYMWTSPGVDKLQVLQLSHLPSEKLQDKVVPHRFHPSDHFMLAMEFVLSDQKDEEMQP